MGKGKDPNEAAREHQSAPLATLKDPASFGPPPKRVAYGAAAASPSASSTSADTGGLGAPVQGSARQRLQEAQEAQAREEEAHKPPPGPYKADTTGLSTAHLPKPPAFRPGSAVASPTTTGPSNPKPRLPPRLPPRQNSHPDASAPEPPPPYSETSRDNTTSQGYLNQGALNRLGRAGVSVPGLNIARNASPPVPPRQKTPPNAPAFATADASQGSQLSELQSRFAKMSTPSSEAPVTGTTWAQKQAALKTAGNLRDDPSKVSMTDMRSAASTANNFRERHGEQAAAGWRAASGLNQKYGLSDRFNTAASQSTSSPPPQSPTQSGIGKKAPPPPPPKKKDITTSPTSPTSPGKPPPVPLGSKPKF